MLSNIQMHKVSELIAILNYSSSFVGNPYPELGVFIADQRLLL